MTTHKTLNEYIQSSVRNNWEELALTDFKDASYRYNDVARKIAKLHILYESAGIKKGDKIALCGKNSAQWAIAFLSVLTYGAVAVPILHEFKPDNIHHLLNHSDSRLAFIDLSIWDSLNPDAIPAVEGVINVADYNLLLSRSKRLTETRDHLNEDFGKRYPCRFTKDNVVYHIDSPEELAIINYTSGSTGFSKGVMIPYRALWSNLQFCIDHLDYLHPGDPIVCMLPMAHMYGLMVDLIHCFCKGCHIYFLTRVPSPKIIMEAFAQARPKLIVAVPLIIEKIVKTKVFPLLDKPLMKLMMTVPFVNNHLYEKIREQLKAAFGGNLRQLIIGGAGLNKDVETFLRRIKFPYTVGYGMTECAPLIAYAPWDEQKQSSCGKIVDRMQAYIDSPDPVNTPGVLWVKGTNVMQGYYKNPQATESVFHNGWMNTGDICTMDTDGYLFIRGRDKSMILGPSGQNIYPEEIEQKLDNMPYVNESLVVADTNNKLVALIHPDFENATKEGMSMAQIEELMKQNVAQLNKELPAYSQLSSVKIYENEFEKTPKRSIKRYLYSAE